VIVVDEIDFLMTKNQNVLYTLFDWLHHPYSKMILICIANRLDFPNEMIAKIKSRMGVNNVIFKTYNHEQI